MSEASKSNLPNYPHPFEGRDAFDVPIELEDNIELPKTLAELRMNAMSYAIRCKKDWQVKMNDPVILEKWKNEATGSQERIPEREKKLTANMINYVFEELKAYAKLKDASTGIQHACDDAVFSSDVLISDELRDALKAEVFKLEDVPEENKDWHPGTDKQVLDLVHPSMYCLVYGKSLVRTADSSAEGFEIKVAEVPDEDDSSERTFVSSKFAWLPADFSVSKDRKVSLLSPYINNIHPSNEGLVKSVSGVLERFIPMFERVLGAVDRNDRPHRARVPRFFRYQGRAKFPDVPQRIVHVVDSDGPRCIWRGGEPDDMFWNEEEGDIDEDYEFLEYPGEDVEERRLNWLRSRDDIILPDAPVVGDGDKLVVEDRFRVANLSGRTLQVIVKLANIHLTPENPKYNGGSWHVEGMLNEGIVSTGIYYYDCENITESHLAFRVSVSAPQYHAQDDSLCMQWLYGMDRDDNLLQDLGQVKTTEGLCLAFPNIYQHCVSPFELADPTKPGHRKILAYFLCDPNYRIPSTTDVAPQQKNWALNEAHQVLADKLPVELRQVIVDNADELMTREEAEGYRAELMKERSNFVVTYNREVVELPFNMCEH